MVFYRKDRFKDIMQVAGDTGTLGLHMVSATFVGLAMGYFLDKWMLEYFDIHTKPWLTMIFLILGIVSGFRMVIQDVLRMQAREKQTQAEAGKGKVEEHDD